MVHCTFLLCISLEFYFIEHMYDCQGRICKPFISTTLLYTYISRFSVDPLYWQRKIYIFVPFTNLRQISKLFAFSVTRFLCKSCRKKYPAEQLLSRIIVMQLYSRCVWIAGTRFLGKEIWYFEKETFTPASLYAILFKNNDFSCGIAHIFLDALFH